MCTPGDGAHRRFCCVAYCCHSTLTYFPSFTSSISTHNIPHVALIVTGGRRRASRHERSSRRVSGSMRIGITCSRGCSSWGCCTRRGLECRDALIGVRRASCAYMHVCRQTAKGCVVVSGVKGHPLHHDQSAGHAYTLCACFARAVLAHGRTRARVASPFPP